MKERTPLLHQEEYGEEIGSRGWRARLKGLCDWCCNPKYMWSVWSLAGTLLVLGTLWWALGNFGLLSTGDFPTVPGSKWQAVFLTNNQVYFGRLQNHNRKYVALKSVYYLQAQQPVQSGQPPANLNIVKLGSEIHGPEEIIFISKDQILFWENLKSDSQVVRGIESTRK